MHVDDEQVLSIDCLVCHENFAFLVPTDVLLDGIGLGAEMRTLCPHCAAAITITPNVQVTVDIPSEIGATCATGVNRGRSHGAPWPLGRCPYCDAEKLSGVVR
jgi:hypothetical protein